MILNGKPFDNGLGGEVGLADRTKQCEASVDEHRRSKILFLGVTFLYWIALYLYVPTLPVYVKAKVTNLSTVGFVLSMYGLMMALARIPMGIVADAIGRGKRLIVAGIFLTIAGAIIMGSGNTIPVLVAGRALTGLSAATWVVLIVVFSTFFEADKVIFASALLTFSSSIGRMAATASTGFLNRAGGYSLAFYTAGLCGLIAILLVLLVKEDRRPPMQVSLRSVVQLFLRRDVLLPTMISIAVHYADWGVTFGFLPILAQEMGMGDVMKSLLISLNIAGITIANLLNTLLLKKVRHGALLVAGTMFCFIGIILIAYSPSIAYLFTGTVCMGFSFGIVYPILVGSSIQEVDRTQRSTAMGMHQAFYAIGMFTGPWLSGIIADRIGIRPTFYLTAGVYLILMLFLLRLLARRTRP